MWWTSSTLSWLPPSLIFYIFVLFHSDNRRMAIICCLGESFFFFLLSTLHFERDRCCHFTVLLPLFWFWLLTRLTSENSWYAQTSHIEAHRAPFQWNGIQSCFASPNTPTAHPFLLSHPRIICNICTNDKKYMYNEMLGSHRIVNVGHTAPQIHGVYKYSYQLYAAINTKMNDL